MPWVWPCSLGICSVLRRSYRNGGATGTYLAFNPTFGFPNSSFNYKDGVAHHLLWWATPL